MNSQHFVFNFIRKILVFASIKFCHFIVIVLIGQSGIGALCTEYIRREIQN